MDDTEEACSPPLGGPDRLKPNAFRYFFMSEPILPQRSRPCRPGGRWPRRLIPCARPTPEEAIINDVLKRQEKWTPAVAICSRGFVEAIEQ
jgi:hypothetical protein